MMSLTLLVGSLLLSSPVSEDLPPLDRQSEDVHLDFTATAWFPRLIGTYSFGPDGTDLDVETDTDLHDSELSFSGVLDIRFDVWTIRVLGSDFDTSGNGLLDESARVSGVQLAAGSDWSSSYGQWSIATEVDLALWRPFADEPFPWSETGTNASNRNAEGDYLLDFRLSGTAGIRYTHVSQSFRSIAAGVDTDVNAGWTALMFGFMIEVDVDTRPIIPWLQRVEIDAGATISPVIAGGNGYLSGIEANLRAWFTENTALVFGFQLQGTAATSGEYERTGSVMGLLGGLSIQF